MAIDAASSDRGSKPRRTAFEARRPDTRAARGRAKAGRSYSITSSVGASSVDGTSTPSACAACRLLTGATRLRFQWLADANK